MLLKMSQILAYAVVAAALADGVKSPASHASPVELRFHIAAPLTLKYKVHRVWKTTPTEYASDQVHDISVEVTAEPPANATGRTRIDLKVLHFTGVDQTHQEGVHLKKMAPVVEKLRLLRSFSPKGAVTSWDWMTSNDSLWVGMMTAKALGMFEIGFLDAALPDGPVQVGSRWTKKIPFGDEGIYSDKGFRAEIHDVKGNEADCTFKVQGLDLVRRTVTLGFFGKADSSYVYDSWDHKKLPMKTSETQSGSWVLNLDTGLPIKFHADRRVIRLEPSPRSTASSVTDIVLVK